MKISIITPTLQREALVRCCESVNNQSYEDWEHVVVVDCDYWNDELIEKIEHPQRKLFLIGATKNWGNTPRHVGWLHTSGSWIIYLDCDNYLADEHVLGDLAVTLSTVKHWGIFPIMRHGHRFFHDPPGMCMTDTLNVVVRREIGRWPNIEAREADGHLVEALKSEYPYTAFPDFRPIGVMEQSSGGV